MSDSLSPDQINAIVRNPDDPRYPAQITVYCDRCGATDTGDYIVHEEDDSATRFGYARAHLAKAKGWTCNEHGDFCPNCNPREGALDPRVAQDRQRENEAVERWNNHHLVGTPVRYWPGAREGAGIESITRTPAQMLGGHSAVVWVEGYSSCIFLTHVEAITERDGGAA